MSERAEPCSPAVVKKRPLEERLSSPPSAPSSKPSPAKTSRRVTPSLEPRLRHVVMFGLKAEATAEQKEAMASGIRGMVDNIPEILKITCGYDIGISQGNRDFVLCADFSDEASYQKYAQHPAHLDVINTLIKPIIEPGTRTAVQFSLAQGNM